MANSKLGPADEAPADDRLLPLLEYLARVGRRAVETTQPPGGLRSRHLIALRLLGEQGPASQQGLAESLSLDPSNVVGLLNELEERELVVRRRDPADRRRHIVEVSRLGEEELSLACSRLRLVEDELFSALSSNERAALYDLLVRAVGVSSPPCDIAEEPLCPPEVAGIGDQRLSGASASLPQTRNQ